MQEIPIAIEENGSELFAECTADALNGTLDNHGEDLSMPIAVVGMGFRGPGDATDVHKLWKMILEQREAWKPIPEERWNNKAFYHPDHARHGTINVKGGHFLEEDVSLFDAPFFNMTSDEAAAMDPQQRLLLEVTYEGLENAGIPLTRVMGSKTSCFVGSFCADFTDLLLRDSECIPMYQCTNAGQSRAMMANRISYFFDLKGPSVTVDTACSGSLVALHLACQSLRTGDASMAIASGVNLILSHEFMSTMSMMRFLSPDGRCYTFDEKANGYARGEAIACLILKPLSHALRDEDTIRAVIRGTGSNQDGRTPGITLPSGTAQEALIQEVYHRAGLDPTETEVIEAHGTGTQAGDPIETGAISRVFGPGRLPDQPIRIGSIKTNVGHLEGASGVAGLIKAVLMLENRMILPSRNFQTPNPRIPLEKWNLKVQTIAEPWETPGPHRVSVNSFGYGGSNAHVIVEDASGYLARHGLQRWCQRPPSLPSIQIHPGDLDIPLSRRHRAFMVSGFDEWSCTEQIKRLSEYLEAKEHTAEDDLLDDLAFTLNEHRSQFMYKAAVVGSSISDLTKSLTKGLKIRSSVRRPTLAFVFTGQGAQWAGMGKELLDVYPVFRSSISRIDRFLSTVGSSFSVYEEICKSPDDSQLSHPLLSQTVCSALQIALVDLLASWGVHPDSVTGHSSGEIAAAYACGALSMQDAMAVAYYRGLAATQLLTAYEVKGAMMAIGMSPVDVEPYVANLSSGKAVVACVNSPSSVTVSGDARAIDALTEDLRDTPVFSRRLAVDVAYHSHHMEFVANEYLGLMEHIQPRSYQEILQRRPHFSPVLFFSSVTGTEIPPEELGAQYWVSNLLGQVKFADSLKTLCFETRGRRNETGLRSVRRTKRSSAAQKASVDFLLEVGPHSALSGPVKQILQADVKLKAANIGYESILSRRSHAVSSALNAVSTLASLNYPLDPRAINFPGETRDRRVPRLLVDMPAYSWNHSRSYWAEPRLSKTYRNRAYPQTDLLGAPDTMACSFEPRWRNYLRVSEKPWLMDHRIQSDIVFPAAGYVSMAIEAAMQLAQPLGDIAGFALQNISIRSALIIPEAAGVEIMTSLRKSHQSTMQEAEDDWYTFHIYSVSKDNRWTEHCTGTVGVERDASSADEEALRDVDGFLIVPPESEPDSISVVDVQHLYERLRHVGLEYGPCFAKLTSAHTTTSGACFAEIEIPDTAAAMPMSFEHPLLIHPCTLDSMFHTIFAALPKDRPLERGPVVPISVDNMRLSSHMSSSPGKVLGICTHVRASSAGGIVASIMATDSDDRIGSSMPKLSINGLRCARLEIAPSDVDKSKNVPLAYGIAWQPDPSFLFSDWLSIRLPEQHSVFAAEAISQETYEDYTANLIKHLISRLDREDGQKLNCRLEQYRANLSELLQLHNAKYPTLDSAERVQAKPAKWKGPINRMFHAIEETVSSIGHNDLETVKRSRAKLWDAHWDLLSSNGTYLSAARYLDLIGHKEPGISILEIGGRTGQPCTMFLEHLMGGVVSGRQAVPHCARYTFSYQNDSELDQAKLRLAPWSEIVDYTQLDIERDLSEQGVSIHSFDVILVPHGLHSAYSIPDTLSNLKSVLKPSGYLIILDKFHPKQSILDAVMISALYLWPDGAFDSSRSSGMRENELISMLHDAGLTANNFAEESPQGSHRDILIVSRPQMVLESTGKQVLIIRENGETGFPIEPLEHSLRDFSCEVTLTDLANAQAEGRICVVLDMQTHLLTDPQSNTLQRIKEIFLHSAGVLWITRGGTIEPMNPEAGLALGFARTARSESGVNPIITLDLDPSKPLPDFQTVDTVLELIKSRFLHKALTDEDTEYAERGGALLIPRIVERADLNRDINEFKNPEVQSEQPFRQPEQPLRLARANARHPQPHFTTDSPMPELPAGYVGIEVHAFGLSECDIQENTSEDQPSNTLGLECSGRVYAVGSGVHDFTVGDRVLCLGAGTARTFYHDQTSAFQKIDKSMSYEVAAALPVAYSTAYYVVHHLARTRVHDTVLIHDAASWCGQAIADMCFLQHATIIGTVKDTTEKKAITNIPSQQIFIHGEDNIVKEVLKLTQGKKAHVVISFAETDSPSHRSLWKCVAPFGRFIHIRSRDAEPEDGNNMPGPMKNILFSTFNMFQFQKDRAEITRHILGKITHLFRDGMLHGPPSSIAHKVSEIEKAVDLIPLEKHVVVTAVDNDMVKTILPKNENSLFRGDASYILVGGLGGIGLAIASWMADHGAKFLILINRSGLSGEAGRSTVRELRAKGVQVAVHACDISNEANVAQLLLEISQNQPPIRGVIHGAMVLKDVHIERMTADDYQAVLRPRYNGTWNLHKHLPTDLDFFVMLSSISGVIGNATQSAYAAGSAFMDAFAAYRNTMGLPAVSLDLGTITDVGYLAANKDLATRMERQGFRGTDKTTLLFLVQLAISQPPTTNRSQIVTGLGEWKAGESLGNFDAPLFSHFRRRFQGLEKQGRSDDTVRYLRDTLRASKSHEEATPIIFDALSGKIAAQLDISVDRVDPSSPLSEFGVDSHVAVELRNWISKVLESTVSILEILASDSVIQLAGQIAGRSLLVNGSDEAQ